VPYLTYAELTENQCSKILNKLLGIRLHLFTSCISQTRGKLI